ncbi:isochorismate synthase MenF [Pseudomonas sp. RIT-PI-S]|uniref:isochorismate synthase n=1 Tax=Pseudomonas sp. RIT-PI-S TaxID=3035295 RepID=UPI0021DA26E0|nr:isochorismate synthase MenF [Pseudomonas sp. RIT-PI-S]
MTKLTSDTPFANADGAAEHSEFLFRSGTRCLRGQGIFAAITTPAAGGDQPGSALHAAVSQAFANAHAAGIEQPVLIGAIPFDTTQPSCLYVPRRHRWIDGEPARSEADNGGAAPVVISQRSVPDEAGFKAAVGQAIANFRSSTIRKAVLSRMLEVQLDQPVKVEQVLARLAAQNPNGYHFRIPLAEKGELIGVSPELLVRKRGGRVYSNPLAGSAKRRANPEEDRHTADALLDSEKDHYEHRLVVEEIRRVLAPECSSLAIPEQPSLLSTAAMWHLSTAIEGELADPRRSSLQLACQLHPTPAVCGAPTDLARKLINLVEPFERGLFTGMVGWCDAAGNGEWVVTIRCGTVVENTLRLFAGAGIVEASEPAAEWAETQAKLGTMLAACGLNAEDQR